MGKRIIIFFGHIIIIISATLFTVGCEKYGRERTIAQSNCATLEHLLSKQGDLSDYIISSALDCDSDDYEYTIKLSPSVFDDRTILFTVVDRIEELADSCKPLYYYYDSCGVKNVKEFTIRIKGAPHQYFSITLATMIFLERDSISCDINHYGLNYVSRQAKRKKNIQPTSAEKRRIEAAEYLNNGMGVEATVTAIGSESKTLKYHSWAMDASFAGIIYGSVIVDNQLANLGFEWIIFSSGRGFEKKLPIK